jgi:hypothetical protein
MGPPLQADSRLHSFPGCVHGNAQSADEAGRLALGFVLQDPICQRPDLRWHPGGIPNFLRCHISVITLLDRMAKLPGLKVTVGDEGKYGPSTYSDDWKEANEAGRKPTYRRHKGLYNPATLAQEVGEWNTMIAGITGALNDALANSGMGLEAPIKDFPDFERLEFRGRNVKYLEPFLKAMKALSATSSAAEQ